MILEQLEKIPGHGVSRKMKKEMTKEEFEGLVKSILSNSETYEKISFKRGYLGIGLQIKGGQTITWWEERKEED